MRPDYSHFFREYARLYNKALTDSPDYQRIMDCFTDSFLGAGPDGVQAGRNGPEFRAALEKGYAFYQQLGAKAMHLRRAEVTLIDAAHDMVKVFWGAEYEKNGTPLTIEFDVTYLLESGRRPPKIFAFITGDEMGAFRRAGLVD